MAEKKWEHPPKAKRKTEKHVAVCQDCLKLSTDKGMTDYMYFYVDRGNHLSLECIDCVDKLNLKIVRPYREQPKSKGRPKGSKNTKKKTND